MSQQDNLLVAAKCVGESRAYAEAIATSAGLRFRSVRIDGAAMMKTNDARLDRLNFDIENDIVTKATLG